jgi:Gas vesicle synthesis protein GvpL/GvpF
VIEVYAITDHPAPPLPDLAPLRLVATGELAAVFAPAGDGATSPEALWRHEEIVEALMEDRDLLPVRYGARFADERAAAGVVQRRHADLVAALDRVRGAVELSLRVIDAGAATEEDGARHAIHEPLAELSRESARRALRAPSELLRSAYLVDREAVRPFADRVGRLQDAHPDLRLLCTGPWPPYSFVEA